MLEDAKLGPVQLSSFTGTVMTFEILPKSQVNNEILKHRPLCILDFLQKDAYLAQFYNGMGGTHEE